ncbi:hypothetical protein H8N03_16885 [Ramlibacter sp. USB13]|uniref:Molecular chaperone DnaJ n=1 Tax=Ramlibacter cellulosilyticus TaxID=2764187 RepID=A0A923MTB1_9BURK|nr:hypothetical protein [Ramlibacter cellulosilyticus]MBC5784626.1 hypothetical protein [Ramlibacter cellulosilyticus]
MGMSRAQLPVGASIVRGAPGPVQEQAQSRFDALVQEVARWRAAVQEWKDRTTRYHQAVEPVRRELHAAWRQWVLALDDASLQPGLSRTERARLDELVRDTAAALLELDDDAELAAIASRHAEDTASAVPRQDDAAPPLGGHGLLEDLAQAWEQEAAAAAAQRAAWAAQRRAASAAKRRKKEEQEVSQSLRDVYRRVASALHPDREPDAQRRAHKTALMQHANQAYADEDLLALLELQLQAEQVDAARAAPVDGRRLQHYVTVLQEQVAELQAEAHRLEAAFRAATGLPAGSGLQPRKADRVISSEAQRLRGELQDVRRQVRSLTDLDAVKAWLKG